MHSVSQEKIPEIFDMTLRTLAADRVLPVREWDNFLYESVIIIKLNDKISGKKFKYWFISSPWAVGKKSTRFLYSGFTSQFGGLSSVAMPQMLRGRHREQEKQEHTGKCRSDLSKGVMISFCEWEDTKVQTIGSVGKKIIESSCYPRSANPPLPQVPHPCGFQIPPGLGTHHCPG